MKDNDIKRMAANRRTHYLAIVGALAVVLGLCLWIVQLPIPNSRNMTSLVEIRRKVSFSVFIPTVVPAELVPDPPVLDEKPPGFVRVNYRTKDGSTGLIVFNGPIGSGLDADTRKKGETVKLRGDIIGHFLNIEPRFGGSILWWEESGSYVALSGPDLNMTDLIKIADSMSLTADIK
ncbi:hypothetical protein [Desulfitobacterium sp. AusDCA]|uniref:hypothetical protein n=1 Tax=Desulfitobacterium sp. AusDCA TaxID=3240383 RepID=UPI003DA7A678